MAPSSAKRRLFGYVSLATLLLLVQPSIQEYDPVANFCRRWGHRTTVVNDVLYIDGGMLNWPSNNADILPTNVTNTFFFNQPLKSFSASAGMPQLYNNITKPGSAPSTSGGALWGDSVNNKLYFYGGEYTGQQPPQSLALWSYDISANNWSTVAYDKQFRVNGLSYGASASPPASGMGYYFGGWQNNATVASWSSSVPVATANLLSYDMDAQSWQNASAPDDGLRRAEGVMVYLPMSDQGMLVYFGGVIDQFANGTIKAQEMDSILLYDIANARWYTQRASGDIPGNRRRFCADAAWAKDRSSYNIYLYGGAGIDDDSPGYDDSYILSIPSFKWIKLYQTVNGNNQHYSSSCNMVSNGAQMLIIGGTFPATSACDVPQKWGTHNLDTGVNNPNNAPWYTYVPTKTVYHVPSDVVSVIGGNSSGSATLSVPSGGFDHPDLASYVTRTAALPTRTPTNGSPATARPSSSHDGPLSSGAIAGISIGAVAIVLLLGVIAFVMLRRRLMAQRSQQPALIPFMPTQQQPQSSSPGMATAWVNPQQQPQQQYGIYPMQPSSSPVSPQSQMGRIQAHDAVYLAAQQRLPAELPTTETYSYQPPQDEPAQLSGDSPISSSDDGDVLHAKDRTVPPC
ncbi:Kelch repeat-containing protein [Ceratocystis lukuohia]|uniref:Kelch repeat-containing protein n=3 Tax=Ceratocystis TaxID=5157 RepID=A0A0F8B7H8_CERFI|nr:hypothetical protein CFO_g787 [Ceratocystis platani]PHH54351.1 Kelch repeat-containing protein [Ceratocystis fimbriata CBS 114723]